MEMLALTDIDRGWYRSNVQNDDDNANRRIRTGKGELQPLFMLHVQEIQTV